MLGIVGLGAAAELVTLEQEATARHMASMRDALQHQLVQAFPSVRTKTCMLAIDLVLGLGLCPLVAGRCSQPKLLTAVACCLPGSAAKTYLP